MSWGFEGRFGGEVLFCRGGFGWLVVPPTPDPSPRGGGEGQFGLGVFGWLVAAPTPDPCRAGLGR